MNAGWYFTAPWDSVPIRRGDALGLRAGADYFADLLAPGLSNATSDARWISDNTCQMKSGLLQVST